MNLAAEIKLRLDITSVVSDHVRLEKSGHNLRGLCPFHTEKTPSFFVMPERQSWRCFGCGEGGDLISFVMKKEGLDFGEAVKLLAQRAGIPLDERKVSTSTAKIGEKIHGINNSAAQYFHEFLLTSATAQKALEYLSKRGLTQAAIEEFRLGFSPNEWHNTHEHLRGLGYSDADMVAAGLLVQKDGRTYDRFRGRLMFPICDAGGRVVGFGARALDDSQPKYLNSPESALFNKSSILYGLDRAKAAIREQGRVVIVEGYMDVITAHQHGFRDVVASMGTALTDKHISILKGLTKHICLSLDPDAAGTAATLRGIEVCRQTLDREDRRMRNFLGGSSELTSRIDIISLPEGKDPDELIRSNSEEWKKLVDGAQSLMEYRFEAVARKADLARPDGKSQVSKELLPLIAEMKDSVEREYYIHRLSQLTGLSDRKLLGIAANLHTSKSVRGKWKETPIVNSGSKVGDRWEEYCLNLLIRYPSLRGVADGLTSDHFERTENREVFLAWKDSPHIEGLWQNITQSLHDHLDMIVEIDMPPLDLGEQEKALNSCICRIEERKLRYQLVTEAETALANGECSSESSTRLTGLQRRRIASGWR